MKIGDRIIITHDNTYHGIPIGKVVPVMKIPVPYMVAVAYNNELHFPNSDEIAEIGKNDEVEAELLDRDYKRFFFWVTATPFLAIAIILCVISILFLTTGDGVLISDITASFACLAFALSILVAIKKKKKNHEQRVMGLTQPKCG